VRVEGLARQELRIYSRLQGIFELVAGASDDGLNIANRRLFFLPRAHVIRLRAARPSGGPG
jgi:hypothetical protein